ncbi:MAG: hypothetical protein MK209_07680 [Planctomycetes bacterium]|nr:hypothetical protein [Planctomycetota bacterium]
MTHSQDTSAPVLGASSHPALPARPVFVVGQRGSFPPAANAAETIFRIWIGLSVAVPPALIWAAEDGAPQLIDHLRTRVLLAPVPSQPLDADSLQAAVHGALDEGATLIGGGLPEGKTSFALTLLIHLDVSSCLVSPQAPVGPVLAMLASEPAAAADATLAALSGSLAFYRLGEDGQLESSSAHPTT